MTIQTSKTSGGPFAYTVQSGAHSITVDLSVAAGGNDLGPGPHDLFDASLAACTALTLTVYARRKQWPLDDVRISVTHDDSEEKNGLYRLLRKIELIGALDEEQRQRLMQIADQCPIHKLMHAKIDIHTESI